jgi:L-asparagine oxygenase
MYSTLISDDDAMVDRAKRRAGSLSASVRDQVDAFRLDAAPSGCLLLKGMPIGELPPTPATPTAITSKTRATELLILSVGSLLGEPVGYQPEHGGDVVQNLVPVHSSSTRQTSTSSKVNLMFHTEAAFHPHRPKYLLLLCLRGDPSARTTVASVHAALPHLSDDVVDVLFQTRFRCAVDESYLHGRANSLGAPMAVLCGDRANPAMVFDEDLMVGTDEVADAALRALGSALSARHDGIVLEAGDLVILDNDMVVHGRSPFEPRFDGTDRWLQRAMVVTDLAASEGERVGRTITTVFGD